MASHPTVGVEEEFLLVDPDTGNRSRAMRPSPGTPRRAASSCSSS